MNVREIREKTKLNRKQFAALFDIPYRTLEDWECGRAKCAPYLLALIVYKLEKEGLFCE